MITYALRKLQMQRRCDNLPHVVSKHAIIDTVGGGDNGQRTMHAQTPATAITTLTVATS